MLLCVLVQLCLTLLLQATAELPFDCQGKPNGPLQISPDGLSPFLVQCLDGWIVMQKRTSASVDFFRGWDEYKTGFGDESNFYLGNEKIHRIVGKGGTLKVQLWDGDQMRGYAEYSRFVLLSELAQYAAEFGGYTGNIGDSLNSHSGFRFSTKDMDNDQHASNCADTYFGGWWYQSCHASNLNGKYLGPGPHKSYADGIEWHTWRGHYHSMANSLMLIRPVLHEKRCKPSADAVFDDNGVQDKPTHSEGGMKQQSPWDHVEPWKVLMKVLASTESIKAELASDKDRLAKMEKGNIMLQDRVTELEEQLKGRGAPLTIMNTNITDMSSKVIVDSTIVSDAV